jgi:argininosuccinate lyase
MIQHTIVKPWSGRFTEVTNANVETFSASVAWDKRLYRHDIQGSITHANMLAQQNILTIDERNAIVRGLENILLHIEQGKFTWSEALEDVHMNIEAALVQDIGDVGKKLHTGRSRNDQVATDIRLYLREEIYNLRSLLLNLRTTLLNLAENEADTIMPGFTHLQIAQPITFGYHLLAWQEMLERDNSRLKDCATRMNISPLGSAALAGTSYPLDRTCTAQELGFTQPSENGLDSVSDRDFAIEFTSAASICMMHLSRFSEELVLWTSAQFKFVELADGFCTGSSIMPQKKNPDVPELIRGKSGRVFGHLIALLTLMKGQPLAYNRDNQEDKEPLFDTIDTLKACLNVFTALMTALRPNRDIMRAAAKLGYSTATDLADYLVRKGVPFRSAHEIVGKIVAHALKHNAELIHLDLETLRNFSPLIESDVFAVLTVEGSVAARNHYGGTAPQQVKLAVVRAKERLNLNF